MKLLVMGVQVFHNGTAGLDYYGLRLRQAVAFSRLSTKFDEEPLNSMKLKKIS